MASLILLIIFGLGIAYFATQNTGVVHILLGSYLVNSIPLYIVVIGSILFGVFISWLISFVNAFSTLFTLHGKDVELKKFQQKITDLEEKNHEQKVEIAHLKGEKHFTLDTYEEEIEKPSLLQNIKHAMPMVGR